MLVADPGFYAKVYYFAEFLYLLGHLLSGLLGYLLGYLLGQGGDNSENIILHIQKDLAAPLRLTKAHIL
jgi:hypothetical protein